MPPYGCTAEYKIRPDVTIFVAGFYTPPLGLGVWEKIPFGDLQPHVKCGPTDYGGM